MTYTLTKEELRAQLDLCPTFLVESGRTSVDTLYGERNECSLEDFLSMPIRAVDQLTAILRESVLPQETLEEIDSIILERLSANARVRLASTRTSGPNYYAAAAHKYVMDFPRLTATPLSPTSINPVTEELEEVPDYLPPDHPEFVSAAQVKEHVKTSIRSRADSLLSTVLGVIYG